MKEKTDKIFIGFIAGMLFPVLAFIIYCVLAFPGLNIISMINSYTQRKVLSHVISLAAIANLPLFFGFLGSKRENSARGVINATIVYVVVVVIIKFF